MSTDLSLASLDQVIALIRETNSIAPELLGSHDVNLVDPQALVDHPSGKNTQILVESKPNRRYIGDVPVRYNRLDLDGLNNYGELTVELNPGEAEAEILAAINAAYGSNLSSVDDITMSSTTNIDYDGDIITITAKVTSLAWIGSLSLIVKFKQTELASILVNSTLAGLEWPIIQQLQTIVFGNPGAQVFGTTPQVTATASSGLEVSFETATPAVCDVTVDGEVTFLTTGNCTLVASQEGNEYFYAADDVSQTFQVNPTIPAAPTDVVATPTTLGASVTFTPPEFTGGAPITGYSITRSPGNVTVSGASLPLTFTGLNASTQYTFTGTVTNSAGTGPSSAASSPITPLPSEVGDILTGTVTQLTDIPANNYKGVGGVVGNGLVLIGGSTTSGGTANGATRRYNISANTWGTNGPGLENFIRNGVSAVHNGLIHVFGGGSSNTIVSSYHYQYDPVANTWTSRAPIPFATRTAAAAVVGQYIYVFGGRDNSSNGVRSLARYNTADNTWTTLASSPAGTGDLQFGMIHRNGKLYTFSSAGTGIDIKVIGVYDIATNTWSTQTVTDNTGRSTATYPTGAVLRNTLYMFSNDMVTYFDLETMSVKRVGTVNFGIEVTAIAGDDEIYVLGGVTDPNGLRRLT